MKMKVEVCVLIVCWQLFGVNCLLHFTKNDLIKSLCVEKPNTLLIVNSYNENDFVELWNEENSVKARVAFHEDQKVTVKNFLKAYIMRAFSDFLPYRINTTAMSSSTANSSTFIFKRFDKGEDIPTEMTFYKGFFLTSPKGKDQWQLTGMSSVWLGCPQPMCLYGTVDAAFYDKSLHVTRGIYYWDLKDGPPMSSNAKLLRDYAKGVTEIIDAAFVTGNLFWYFKDKRVYCWELTGQKICANYANNGGADQDLPWFFNVPAEKAFTPEFCEAGFAFANAENARVALYGEETFTKLAIFKKKAAPSIGQWYEFEKITDFPLLFHKKIDAMANVDGNVIIFMQWMNYKVPVTAFETTSDIDSKKSASFVSFADPFKCSKDLYKGWVYDYDKYADEMNQIVQFDVPASDFHHRIDILETAQRVGTTKPSDEQSALPFILAAILIAAIIIIIIVILTEKKRRARKKKQQENKPEEVDLRAPAMGSNIDTRSVMGSQILDADYKPGKKTAGKAPSSKLDSKVSGTGSTIGGSGSKLSGTGSKIGGSGSKVSGTGSKIGGGSKVGSSKIDSKKKAKK